MAPILAVRQQSLSQVCGTTGWEVAAGVVSGKKNFSLVLHQVKLVDTNKWPGNCHEKQVAHESTKLESIHDSIRFAEELPANRRPVGD